MKARITSVVLLLLGVASVVCYINDLDFLVVACQILSLMVFKNIPYSRRDVVAISSHLQPTRPSQTLSSVTTP